MSSTNSTSQPSTGSEAGKEIKGVFAGIHGLGETIRGTVNSAVDETFSGSKNATESAHGMARNDAVTQGGLNEIKTGQFTQATKEREGAQPGDKTL